MLYFCTENTFQKWILIVGFSLIKAVYITGKEVFSFKMVSFVDATAGSAYTDMNVVDVQVTLTVGCIEVVFVTKFLCSILVSILIDFFIFSYYLEVICCVLGEEQLIPHLIFFP